MYVYIYKYICINININIYIYILITNIMEHLNRCKTSIWAEGGSRVQSLPPTKTLWLPWWYMAWSAMRTCIFHHFSLQWQPAKARTGMSNNWFLFFLFRCTCCRNLSTNSPSTGHGVPFRIFSGLFIDPVLSGVFGVFLRVKCIPHQNSQRLFWASVWFMLDSSRWHEPLGEWLV